MRRSSSLWLGWVAVALAGCGSGKLGGGKEGAAQALALASGPAWTINASASQSGMTATVSCREGGTIALQFTAPTSAGAMSYTADYRDCSTDGKSRFNGTLITTTTFESSSTSAVIVMRMVADLAISGAISDFLRADVTQSVAMSTTSTPSTVTAAATIVLDGWIETSSDRYLYASETLQVDMSAELPQG